MERFAAIECIFAKVLHATRDGNGFECYATAEGICANALYSIGLSIMRNCVGDVSRYKTAIVGVVIDLVGYLYSVRGGITGDAIEQIARFEIPCPKACGNHYGEKEEIKSFHNEIIYDLRCKDTESFRYTQKNRRKFTFSAIFLCLDFVGLPKKLCSLTTNRRAFPVPLYGYRITSN